jgi:hypothetical protein
MKKDLSESKCTQRGRSARVYFRLMAFPER